MTYHDVAYTNLPVCPFCGEEHQWDGEESIDCPCGSTFNVSVDFDPSFSTFCQRGQHQWGEERNIEEKTSTDATKSRFCLRCNKCSVFLYDKWTDH